MGEWMVRGVSGGAVQSKGVLSERRRRRPGGIKADGRPGMEEGLTCTRVGSFVSERISSSSSFDRKKNREK